MRHFCVCLTLLSFRCQASVDPADILERARQSVVAQLARTANYACVETIDRRYFVNQQPQPPGCSQQPELPAQTLWMRDRLRLDIAVSEGHEIYSWHGEAKFTSSDVSEVVHNGPISSGNFVGFLHDIFVHNGAQFTYVDESEEHGSKIYTFKYVMPVDKSSYHIGTTTRSNPVAPYHGSFSIEGSDYRLTRLQVFTEAIPSDSPICNAVTTITYQLVSISGQPSLLPASFELDLEDEHHIHTISNSEYSQCREFRGESTLHFDIADSSAPRPAPQERADAWLPAGVTLPIELRTPIDDNIAYVGDRVEGALAGKVNVPGTHIVLPKGAVLEGLITKMEHHYVPEPFMVLSVKFNRVNLGNSSFLLNAWPETSTASWKFLRQVYGSPLPSVIAEEERKGLVVLRPSPQYSGSLPSGNGARFSAKWITAIPSSLPSESPSQ